MKKTLSFLLNLFLFASLHANAQTETEPNNSFATANALPYNTQYMCTIGCSGDADDYFKANIPLNKKVRVYLEYTNNGGATGGAYLSVYAKDQTTTIIGGSYSGSVTPLTTLFDTIDIYCRADDSMYFRIYQYAQCIDYKISYEVMSSPSETIDTAGNDSYATAPYFSEGDTINGTFHYNANSVDDADDYFVTKTPRDGILRVYMERTNTSANNSQYFYLQMIDRNHNNFYYDYNGYVNAGATRYDTIDIYCRAADTMYFHTTGGSGGCFSYRLRYEILNNNALSIDTAGNDSYTAAVYFNEGDTINGTIHYSANGVDDADDYFVTNAPRDGTLRIYMERTNTNNNNSQYFYLKLDNKNYNNFYNDFNGYVNAGATRYDTINIYCRAADTIYFHTTSGSGGCFSYRLRYEILNNNPTSIDTAGNDSYAAAAYFNEGDTINGTIHYNANGVDDADDYFVTKAPRDGTLRIYMERTNTNNSNSQYFYLRLDDKSHNNFYNNLNGYVNAGVTRYDTIDIYCRAADTMYVHLTGGNGGCFSYRLRYEILNNNPTSIDTAGNDSYAAAVYFNEGDTINGTIHYSANSVDDADDYFVTKAARDGTLRIYMERTNTNNNNSQYFYLKLDDKNHNNFYNNFNGYVNAGATRYDTINIYCSVADTVYFHITGGNGGCFSYRLRYEILNNNPNSIDTTGNDSYAAAAYFNEGDTINGTIRYGNDADDYFVTETPRDGTLRIYMERTNTNNNNSEYFYLKLDDKNHNNFYNNFNSYVNAGATRYDTIDIYCRNADTIFFHLTGGSGGCFSYRLRYEITLGDDTTLYVCPGFTADISHLYDTLPFNVVTWTNMGGGAMPPLNAAGNGLYRLTVENTLYACSKDTAFVTVGLYPKPNIGNDTTANVCPGFTADLTQFKNTTGLTTQWIGTSTPASVGAGNYTLIVTNTQGCMDTAVITIGLNPKPNIGNDTTANVCPGFTADLTQFKNTTGLTTQWIGTSTPASVGAGNYTLIVTNTQGCIDTAVITINNSTPPNLGNDTTLYAWIGETINFTSIKDTTGFAANGWTHSWSSNINGASNNTSVTITGNDTVYASLIAYNQNGCGDTANITIYPAKQIVPPTGITNLSADAEVTAPDGWTHYYYTNGTSTKVDDILLLSLKKNGNNIGTTGVGSFIVRNVATQNAGSNTGIQITNPLMSNSSNYYVMNRYWQVTAATQPSGNVGVRFYFNTQDYNDANGSFSNTKTLQQLVLYHLKDGNPDPTTNWSGATLPVVSIMNSAQASDTTWTYTNMGNNEHYAEFTVSSFSGGGAGFTGNNQPLPVTVTSFTAMAHNYNALIDWNTALENEIAGYEIQRSEDGKYFSSVYNVAAQNKNGSAYHYTDVDAGKRASLLYYRIKIQEANGSYRFTEIAPVRFVHWEAIVTLFPNPAKERLTVQGVQEYHELKVTDLNGKVILIRKITGNTEILELHQWAAGAYTIILSGENGQMKTLKFIKSE